MSKAWADTYNEGYVHQFQPEPMHKFTSSSRCTEFKDILPRNIYQMNTKTIPISTRIVISYPMKGHPIASLTRSQCKLRQEHGGIDKSQTWVCHVLEIISFTNCCTYCPHCFLSAWSNFKRLGVHELWNSILTNISNFKRLGIHKLWNNLHIRFLKPVMWKVFHFMFYVLHLKILYSIKVPKINLHWSCVMAFSHLPFQIV